MSIFKTHQSVHLLLESALGTEKSVKVGGKLLLTFSTQTLQSVGSIKIALARHFIVTPEEIALSLSFGRQVGYRKVLGSIPCIRSQQKYVFSVEILWDGRDRLCSTVKIKPKIAVLAKTRENRLRIFLFVYVAYLLPELSRPRRSWLIYVFFVPGSSSLAYIMTITDRSSSWRSFVCNNYHNWGYKMIVVKRE